MFGKFMRALAFAVAIGTPTLAQAQQLIGSYVALLSEADPFNSNGQRLMSAAAIIRQDRANFHRFGIRDPQDEDDAFFADEGNRAASNRCSSAGARSPASSPASSMERRSSGSRSIAPRAAHSSGSP
jgi:hypothetical protein